MSEAIEPGETGRHGADCRADRAAAAGCGPGGAVPPRETFRAMPVLLRRIAWCLLAAASAAAAKSFQDG
jgi:hypothetical protein